MHEARPPNTLNETIDSTAKGNSNGYFAKWLTNTRPLVALSCHPLGSHGAEVDSALAASVARTNADLARLRETRRLVVVEPDFDDGAAPTNLMDPNLAIQALQIGKRQAQREAAAIQAAWNL